MLKEWNYTRNNITPETCRVASSMVVWWICDQGHEYQTRIQTKTQGKLCPVCPSKFGYSRAQIRWLEEVMKRDRISLIYALSEGGEFKIPDVGKVDGYCKETNTVYEYHGDYWHGNLAKYDPDDTNSVMHKPYSELFTRTLQRDAKIRSLGYNLVVQWETDFIAEEIPIEYRHLLP
jgi:G:T-mismatch repair DNA endonuclease (very short patch repair protein)